MIFLKETVSYGPFWKFLLNFSPTLIAILALILGFWQIRLQVKLNAQKEWLQKFRTQAADFIKIYNEFLRTVNANVTQLIERDVTEFHHRIYVLKFLINPRYKKQKELYNELEKGLHQLKEQEFENLRETIGVNVIPLCEEIIREEEKKIHGKL